MEDLTKTQLVLLALFVSFVTSLATGIVTVTLVDQAPPGITQTINRVVEHTIERVVPATQPAQIREVVVSSDELLVKAIAQARASVVSFSSSEFHFASGYIAAPGVAVTFGTFPEMDGGMLKVTTESGMTFTAVPLFSSPHVATFKLEGEGAEKLPVLKLTQADVSPGRAIAALSLNAEGESDVALGVISSLRAASSSTTPSIKTTLAVPTFGVGGPAIDTRGAVVGIVVGENTLAPRELIKKALDFTPKNQ